MVTGIALINVEHGQIHRVAEALVDLKGISEVYSVSGDYDLVAIIRVKDNDGLAELMTEKMGQVAGIANTHTMLAFRSYSEHDLESMFSLGQ